MKMAGLKTVTYAKISSNMVNPRDIAGEGRRRRQTVRRADILIHRQTDGQIDR